MTRAMFLGPIGKFAEVARIAQECGVEAVCDPSLAADSVLALIWLDGAEHEATAIDVNDSAPSVAIMETVNLDAIDRANHLGAHGYYALTEPLAVLRAVLRSALQLAAETPSLKQKRN